MERLNVYLQDFSIDELKEVRCLKEYKLFGHEINMTDKSNLEPDVPAIFIFRNPRNSTDLWKYIRTVRARKMNAAFLLLISRQDFALLYGACQNGITAVLMEPASRNELEEQIKRCLRRIAEVTQALRDRAQLEEYEFDKQHRIMERLLFNILEKPEEVEFLLPEINKRYGTKLGEQKYQALVISVNQYELCSKTSHFLKEVTLLAIHTLGLAEEIILGYKEPYGLIGIVYYGKDIPLEDRKEEYLLLWKKIMNLQEYYGEFIATLGVGNMVQGIAEVSDSLRQAAFSQEYRMALGQYTLLAEELPEPKSLEEYVPERKLKELLRYVVLGDVRHVNSWFLEFHQNIEPKFLEYPPAFAKFCWKVYRTSAQIQTERNAGHIVMFPEWKFFKLQHIFDGILRNKELEILLLEICHMMQQDVQDEQDVATQAIAYMKVHYAEPINLDYMAEKCGLSTSYFSRKFKEQTGEKYIDVLTDIRVREAQRLLGTTDTPVAEIVEAVGYCDDKHFRRVFHKVTGMNPLEYRKKIRKENELSENNI